MIGRVARWVDDRTGTASWTRSALRHVFPDHYSFMFGEVAAYAFAVLVGTGVFLTFFFEPSASEVVYDGQYEPLHGLTVSKAYASTLDLSFEVRFGLLMRQMHHWAALVFLLAIFLHLCRVFFTGAFRRPRELNWIVGVSLLLTAIANGFLGYSLVDDLLSGTGLRIAHAIAESIPGSWAANLAFGGSFPSEAMIPRFFVLHIFVVPALIVGLMTLHFVLVWRHKHTQFPGRLEREDNVVGSRLWPNYTARSASLLFGVVAVLAVLGAFVQINPVWLWGPYEPFVVSTGAQPDWYVGWLEGALRLFPAWEFGLFGYTVPALLWPGVVLPALTFGGLYAYPFVEKRITGDDAEHELLERPRERPGRVAFGCGALSFYLVLLIAGSQDVLAAWLDLRIETMVVVLRVALFVLPALAAGLSWRLARDLGADQ